MQKEGVVVKRTRILPRCSRGLLRITAAGVVLVIVGCSAPAPSPYGPTSAPSQEPTTVSPTTVPTSEPVPPTP